MMCNAFYSALAMHLLTLMTASYSCTQQSMEQTIIDMVKETMT